MSQGDRAVNPASLRGLAVMAVAVILGVVLLANTDDVSLSTGARADRSDATTTTAPEAGTTLPGPSLTTTTAPEPGPNPKPAAEVQVIVLNGSGGLAPGVAAARTDELEAQGYQTIEPGNAPSRDVTVVLYAEGFEPDGAAVQFILGLPGTVEPVTDLPTPEAQGADVVVVLGRDAAPTGGGDDGGEDSGDGGGDGGTSSTTVTTTEPSTSTTEA